MINFMIYEYEIKADLINIIVVIYLYLFIFLDMMRNLRSLKMTGFFWEVVTLFFVWSEKTKNRVQDCKTPNL